MKVVGLINPTLHDSLIDHILPINPNVNSILNFEIKYGVWYEVQYFNCSISKNMELLKKAIY